MRIFYTVTDKWELSKTAYGLQVQITPESPINGFYGVKMGMTVSKSSSDQDLLARVRWKIAQDVGRLDCEDGDGGTRERFEFVKGAQS